MATTPVQPTILVKKKDGSTVRLSLEEWKKQAKKPEAAAVPGTSAQTMPVVPK